MFHMYLIFFLSLLGTLLAAAALICWLITLRKPDGTFVRSDWPVKFSDSFQEQIIFKEDGPGVKQNAWNFFGKMKSAFRFSTPPVLSFFIIKNRVRLSNPTLLQACFPSPKQAGSKAAALQQL